MDFPETKMKIKPQVKLESFDKACQCDVPDELPVQDEKPSKEEPKPIFKVEKIVEKPEPEIHLTPEEIKISTPETPKEKTEEPKK